MPWLHYYNRLLAIATLVLITVGGLVTSTDSGLAVPDWPNTYGYFMFSFPLSKMVGGILYEHGHRLIASIVGLLTIGLAFWISRIDSRKWVRRLGWFALIAVIVQGLLGGITVLYFLPPIISISHAGLAQIFFAAIVSLATFTSKGWLSSYDREKTDEHEIFSDHILTKLTFILPCIIYLQIILGATMRHLGAGLAIPDFPLAFGKIIPPFWDLSIAIHFSHRVGAVLVTFLTLATAGHILKHHMQRKELARPAFLLIVVVITQFTLGALTITSERAVSFNTAHVATGALLFVSTIVLYLRVHRFMFDDRADKYVIATEVPLVLSSSNPSGASS
tara:strand:- start:81437 stop:82438 length:1002 start_codon:yes stop_codon:yes gene_type:complete